MSMAAPDCLQSGEVVRPGWLRQCFAVVRGFAVVSVVA